MVLLFSPSPTGLNTEGIYRVSGNKAEMESMQRQFEQGYPSFSASAVFPPVSVSFAFWNLSAKNQNHLGNRDSPITKQEVAAECVGPISSDQLCSSHPTFLNFREVLVMFMYFFRGTHLTLTYLWPITLSCCSNMLTRASARHCKVKATSVCMLGCIYNKSGSS